MAEAQGQQQEASSSSGTGEGAAPELTSLLAAGQDKNSAIYKCVGACASPSGLPACHTSCRHATPPACMPPGRVACRQQHCRPNKASIHCTSHATLCFHVELLHWPLTLQPTLCMPGREYPPSKLHTPTSPSAFNTPPHSPNCRAAVRIQSRFRGYVVRKAYKLYKIGGVVSEILYSPAAFGLDMSVKNQLKPRARINAQVCAVLGWAVVVCAVMWWGVFWVCVRWWGV